MSISRRHFLIGATGGGLLVWVSLDSTPAETRRKKINRFLEKHGPVALPKKVAELFERHVKWVARNAGIKQELTINERLSSGKLNILVTSIEMQELTRCGTGNALYDPELDTIFIDISIVFPYQALLLGDKGQYTMSSIDSIGFASSYLGFILAHEFGHKMDGRRGGAFFDAQDAKSECDFSVEEAADAFAVRTLVRAYQSGDVPDFIQKWNASTQVGLGDAHLSAGGKGAADIMGALKGMSVVLLFSSSPYSPYFFDEAHPDFLSRAQNALRECSQTIEDELLKHPSDLLKSELHRAQSLRSVEAMEIYFPKPIYETIYKDEILWNGCYELDAAAGGMFGNIPSRPPREFIFKCPLTTVIARGNFSPEFEEICSGTAEEGGIPGQWIESQLSTLHGDWSNLGWGSSCQPQQVSLFKRHDVYKPDGLAYAGVGWVWEDSQLGSVRLAAESLQNRAIELWGEGEYQVGFAHISSGKLVIPVASGTGQLVALIQEGPLKPVTQHDGLVVLATEKEETVLDSTVFGKGTLNCNVGDVWLELIRLWRGSWWIPSSSSGGWRLLVSTDGIRAFSHSEAPLIKGSPATSGKAIFKIVDEQLAIFGIDSDSLYLINGSHAGQDLLFHPYYESMRILELGHQRVMIWIRNGQKGYLINLRKPTDHE